jgi:DNA-binding transcriptional ArsR family regulator
MMSQRRRARQSLLLYPGGVCGELDEAIYRCLTQGAYTHWDLHRALGKPRSSIVWALKRLMRNGVVRDFSAAYDCVNGLKHGVTYLTRRLHFYALRSFVYEGVRPEIDRSITEVTLRNRALADRNRINAMLWSHEASLRLKHAHRA